MRSSRGFGVVLLSVLMLAGCRDMVTPERERPEAEFTLVRVIGLGTDGLLDGADVTLDNRAYVAGSAAGEWSAETVGGVAWFVDLPAGTYDASVQPPSSNTPAWEQTAVEIDSTEVTLAYEAVPFAIELDWPELEAIGATPAGVRIRIRYELPRPDSPTETRRAHQIATFVSEGRYEGVLPWAGQFPLQVEAYAGSEIYFGAILEYGYPNLFDLPGTAAVPLISPLRKQAITLEAGGAPFDSAPVGVQQRTLRYDPNRAYALSFEFDPATSDSLYLLPPEPSKLEVFSVESPRFLRQRRYLDAGQMAPGAFDLGDHVLELFAVDSDGQPVAGAQFEVFSETGVGLWSDTDSYDVDVLLHAGRHSVTVRASGYLQANEMVVMDGDASLVVTLEEK